jgi:hypothetical protein
MGLLQSTTTQTDLVISFFLASFVYFGFLIVKEKKISIEATLFLCLSFALGTLTKATFYIFAFPFCLFFGIQYIKIFRLKSFVILFAVIFTFLSLNFQFLNRNYIHFDSPLGPRKTMALYYPSRNGEFGIKATLSNSVKNIGLHLATPNNFWNENIDRFISSFHKFINFPLNSKMTNWPNMKYKTKFAIHHDTTGNFFHIIIFFASCIIVAIKFKKTPKLIGFYFFSIISGFLFFAFLLRWQPWQTRLDLPIFFLIAPLSAYALSYIRWKFFTDFICISLLIISIAILFIFDPIKPFLGKKSFFLKNNSSYIFNYDVASKICSKIKENDISNIGLVLGKDSWEWQYWLLLNNVRFEYIYFHADFKKTLNFDNKFQYKAIIIDNIYLNITQIKELLSRKDTIQEINNVGRNTTLIIFKENQNKIITYE